MGQTSACYATQTAGPARKRAAEEAAARHKLMSLVRAICRSHLADLTIVSYGGPDVGLLLAAGKVRRLVYGFVSLDSIPLEPHFRAARQSGAIQVTEYDEGMLQWALYAASLRLPFLPT